MTVSILISGLLIFLSEERTALVNYFKRCPIHWTRGLKMLMSALCRNFVGCSFSLKLIVFNFITFPSHYYEFSIRILIVQVFVEKIISFFKKCI